MAHSSGTGAGEMKYLINRKTKEHKVLIDDMVWCHDDWQLVGADSEGWIAHTGKECPLPDDVMCDTKWDDGQGGPRVAAYHWKWHDPSITHYRPILTEKVQEPEPTKLNSPRRCSRCFTDDMGKHHPHCPDRVGAARSVLPPQYDPADLEYEKQRAEKEAERKHMEIKEAELKRMMLLDRLKAAHKAAQTIPDLEAELREVLGSMGYDLVARNPFVEAVDSDSLYELAHDTLQSALDDIWACSQSYSHDDLKNKIAFYCEQHSLAEPEATDKDMTDWRNWREGDVLECVNGDGHVSIASGNLVTVRQVQFTNGTIMFCHPDGFEGVALTRRFRFHSRPVKGE